MTSLKKKLLIIAVAISMGLSDAVLAQNTEQKIDYLASELTQLLNGQNLTNPEIIKSNPLTRGIHLVGGASGPTSKYIIRNRTNEFFEDKGIPYTQRWTLGEGDTEVSRILNGPSFISRIKVGQTYFQLAYQENVGIFLITHVAPNVTERFNELTNGNSLSEVTASMSKTPADAINWLLLYFSNEYMGEQVEVDVAGTGNSEAIVKAIKMHSYTSLENFKISMSESIEKLGFVRQGTWVDDDWGTGMFIELGEYEFKLDYMNQGNVLFIVYRVPIE